MVRNNTDLGYYNAIAHDRNNTLKNSFIPWVHLPMLYDRLILNKQNGIKLKITILQTEFERWQAYLAVLLKFRLALRIMALALVQQLHIKVSITQEQQRTTLKLPESKGDKKKKGFTVCLLEALGTDNK